VSIQTSGSEVLVTYKGVHIMCVRPEKRSNFCIHYKGSTVFSVMTIHVNTAGSYVLSADGLTSIPLPLHYYNQVQCFPYVLGACASSSRSKLCSGLRVQNIWPSLKSFLTSAPMVWIHHSVQFQSVCVSIVAFDLISWFYISCAWIFLWIFSIIFGWVINLWIFCLW
jgi:hypothetical protein